MRLALKGEAPGNCLRRGPAPRRKRFASRQSPRGPFLPPQRRRPRCAREILLDCKERHPLGLQGRQIELNLSLVDFRFKKSKLEVGLACRGSAAGIGLPGCGSLWLDSTPQDIGT
jgi:hypothetical protein